MSLETFKLIFGRDEDEEEQVTQDPDAEGLTLDDVEDWEREPIVIAKSPSLYVDIFRRIVDDVRGTEEHLFSPKEWRILEQFGELHGNSQFVLVKLFLRKNKFHSIKKLEKLQREIGDGTLKPALQQLCLGSTVKAPLIDLTAGSSNAVAGPSSRPAEPPEEKAIFCFDDSRMTLKEVLEELHVDQLKLMAKDMKVKLLSSTKEAIINALMEHASKQIVFHAPPPSPSKKKKVKDAKPTKQTSLFTAMPKLSNKTQESLLRSKAIQKLGMCVKVNPDVMSIIRRLDLVYHRHTTAAKSLFLPAILSRFKKRHYPSSSPNRTGQIWKTCEEIHAYEKALILQEELELIIDGRFAPKRSLASRRSRSMSQPAGAVKAESKKGKEKETVKNDVPEMNQAVSKARIIKELFEKRIYPKWKEHMTVLDDSHFQPDDDLKVEIRVKPEPIEADANMTDIEGKKLDVQSKGNNVEVEVEMEDIKPKLEDLDSAAQVEAARVEAPQTHRSLTAEESVFALKRFDTAYVYTRMVEKACRALGTLKEYSYERKVLEELLQQPYRQGKRAWWHERRALLLERYISKDTEGLQGEPDVAVLEEARQGLCRALEDEHTCLVMRPSLTQRLMRIEKTLDIPVEDRIVCDAKLRKAVKVEVVGDRIQHSQHSLKLNTDLQPVQTSTISSFMTTPKQAVQVSGRIVPQRTEPNPRPKATGKSIWKGRDGKEVNVETVALQQYEDQGFKGFHAETRILTTLFALLMWDIMFADILGAFETPYQTAPLDLHEETFYLARKGLIETRLEDIKDIDKAKAILAKHDDKYRPHNVFCCGVRWDLCPKEDLLEIIACIGGDPLSKICRLFCEDYAGRCSGVPDLIVWNYEQKLCKFVEVKGPGDTPMENQKLWFDTLLRTSVQVDLCSVIDKNAPVKKKRQGKKRLRPDVESEDEELSGAVNEAGSSVSPRKRCRRSVSKKPDTKDDDDYQPGQSSQ